METYILLATFNQSATEQPQADPRRFATNKPNFKKLGVELLEFHRVNGQYDIIAVFTAENKKAMEQVVSQTACFASMQTELLKVYSAEEYRNMMKDERAFCEKLFMASRPVHSPNTFIH